MFWVSFIIFQPSLKFQVIRFKLFMLWDIRTKPVFTIETGGEMYLPPRYPLLWSQLGGSCQKIEWTPWLGRGYLSHTKTRAECKWTLYCQCETSSLPKFQKAEVGQCWEVFWHHTDEADYLVSRHFSYSRSISWSQSSQYDISAIKSC